MIPHHAAGLVPPGTMPPTLRAAERAATRSGAPQSRGSDPAWAMLEARIENLGSCAPEVVPILVRTIREGLRAPGVPLALRARFLEVYQRTYALPAPAQEK